MRRHHDARGDDPGRAAGAAGLTEARDHADQLRRREPDRLGRSSNPAEDAFQKVQIFVPAGFGLNAPVGGTAVGTATGHALVKDVDATQEQSFSGKITAAG